MEPFIITIDLNELFFIIGRSLADKEKDTKNLTIINIAENIGARFGIPRSILKNAIKSGGYDFNEPEKMIVAVRTVPRRQPEEMGENGLMWKDLGK